MIKAEDNETYIVVAGGMTKGGPSNSTEILKIGNDSWSDGPDLPYRITKAKMVAANKQQTNYAAYLIGGEVVNANGTYLNLSRDVFLLQKGLSYWTISQDEYLQHGRTDFAVATIPNAGTLPNCKPSSKHPNRDI